MRDGKCHISFEVLAIKISNISKHKKNIILIQCKNMISSANI